MSVCRETCRRVLRGILSVPGCRTVCYRCILPPCYSFNDSDDEKDKDDEGYDSYGNAASESHLPALTESGPESEAVIGNLEAPEYVNSVQYSNTTNVDMSPQRNAENVYVPMKLGSLEHLQASNKIAVDYHDDAHSSLKSRELLNNMKEGACSNSYVNAEVAFSNEQCSVNIRKFSDILSKEENSINVQNVPGNFAEEENSINSVENVSAVSDKSRIEVNDKNDLAQTRVKDGSLKESQALNETHCESDASENVHEHRLVVQCRNRDVNDGKRTRYSETMVLLETDL